MRKRMSSSAILSGLVVGALTVANAGAASAEVVVRSYYGYGAERHCQYDMNFVRYNPQTEQPMCDTSPGRGIVNLVIAEKGEVSAILARIFFSGLSS